MRGALVLVLAAGLALGGILVSASGAPGVRYARAEASVAAGEGAVSSERSGEERTRTGVDVPGVRVGEGEAIARTEAGALGYATAAAEDVEVLGGRVIASGVRRSVTRSASGVERYGRVYGLRVDGKFYGDVQRARTIQIDGGRVALNMGTTGLRVVAGETDIRVSVARVTTFTVTATPTPTPTATATPKPTATTTPKPKKKKQVKRRKAPKVPKRLTRSGYAFPVYGNARVADNFGVPRPKPIVTHEGIDIFAPFGSPVVAVRDGVISRVGTLPISGNRLWLTTNSGDAFFYAHLASFSNAARNRAHVEAGTVLGFVGNTGDAEPTPPHLHFEVRPNGKKEDAVDPYPIVTAWQGRHDVPPGAWLQRLGTDPAERPGALVTVRDFIAE